MSTTQTLHNGLEGQTWNELHAAVDSVVKHTVDTSFKVVDGFQIRRN
jgi:hypothetical protein